MADIDESGLPTYVAGETIPPNRRVKFNAGATSVTLCGADDDHDGVSEGSEDVANGGLVTVRLKTKEGTRKMTVAASTTKGQLLYGAASGKVTPTPTGVERLVGRALSGAGGDGGKVEVEELTVASRVVKSTLADGTTLTNSVAETDLIAKTIDGAKLKKGDVLEIIGRAHMAATNGTDTFNLKAYVGTEEVGATGALDVANGDQAQLHLFVTIRDVGASGKVAGSGWGKIGGASAVPTVQRKDEAAEDLSGAAVPIKLTGTWSVANAGNQAIPEDLIVIHHPQG